VEAGCKLTAANPVRNVTMKKPGAVLRGLIIAALCGLIANAGWARDQPTQIFDGLLVRGYGELAEAVAHDHGSAARIFYFQNRKALAARHRDLAPQTVEGRALDPFTLREAGFARRQLVEKLGAGVRQHQPVLAANAQVNFDCWIAPRSSLREEAQSSECRRRFYFAFAGLRPATAVETQAIAQAESAVAFPRPTPSISGNVEPRERLDPGAVQRAYEATLYRHPSRRLTAAPSRNGAPASLASAIAVFEQAIVDANAARRAYRGTMPEEPRLSPPNSAPPFDPPLYEYGPPPGSR
jgi:hypothetical protein